MASQLLSDPTFPAFPIVTFLGFVLVLIPLPWHLQAWNSGTCLFMIWTAVGSLNLFVNSLVWRASVLDFAPVWCDISSRIIIAVSVAIPACSLCINRRLYHIATTTTASITRAQKRRAVIVDLCIGLGLPLLNVVLAYIVTGHRFDIYEGLGCQPAIYVTAAAFPLVICWPLVIGLVSAGYCILTIRAFMKRRAGFRTLISAHSALSVNRYFRLMALASLDLVCTVPLSAFSIYLNWSSGVRPWISWANVHSDFSRVGQYPAVLWRSVPLAVVSLELSRWLVPFCALVFFAFFGLAQEARRHYHEAYTSIVGRSTLVGSAKKEPFSYALSPVDFKRTASTVVDSKQSTPQKQSFNASTPTLSLQDAV